MKTALATGGGAGIGAAVADRLRSDGYHVAAIDLNPRPGRIGKCENIAAACAFYISQEAGYVTGQILDVNAGRNT